MSAVAILAPPPRPATALLGRPFLGHALDHLVIGGGLSLLVVLWVVLQPTAAAQVLAPMLPFSLVLVNGAHFAASTGRLYTRPGALERWPFLTHVFPFVALAAILAGVTVGGLGRHVQALYFTWSPFHYAAQTYGLAAMYCARSGTALGVGEARWLRLACLLPFLFAFVASPSYGIYWLVPPGFFTADATRLATLRAVHEVLRLLTWVAPVAFFLLRWIVRREPVPLIVLVLMLANASWWLVLGLRDEAFGWAAVFHGLQYLAIVAIFHVRERPEQPAWRRGLLFYVACVAGGYALFNCWPVALAGVGLGAAGSVLMVTAVVNIHHFVVDAYIWKIRRDPNAAVVAG